MGTGSWAGGSAPTMPTLPRSTKGWKHPEQGKSPSANSISPCIFSHLSGKRYKISFLGKCILMSLRSLMQVNHLSLTEPVGSQRWHEPGVRCLTYYVAQFWRENTKRPYIQWSKFMVSLMAGFAWFCCIVTCFLKLQHIPLNFIRYFLTDIVLKTFMFLQIEESNLSYMPLVKRTYVLIHCQGPKFKVLFGKVIFNMLLCFLVSL